MSASCSGLRVVTYRFLRQVCIEADVLGGYVQITLEEDALKQPARVLCYDRQQPAY
jgi:hypothetical protein